MIPLKNENDAADADTFITDYNGICKVTCVCNAKILIDN